MVKKAKKKRKKGKKEKKEKNKKKKLPRSEETVKSNPIKYEGEMNNISLKRLNNENIQNGELNSEIVKHWLANTWIEKKCQVCLNFEVAIRKY